MTAKPRESRELRAFNFLVRRPDGSERNETFYAADPKMAAKYARAWARRMGFAVVETSDDHATKVRAA